MRVDRDVADIGLVQRGFAVDPDVCVIVAVVLGGYGGQQIQKRQKGVVFKVAGSRIKIDAFA